MDYAKEYGIDLDRLVREGFAHPIAQWENALIAERGEAYWERYRRTHPVEPDGEDNPKHSKPRRPRKYSFTDEQMAIAMRSIRESH